MDSNGHVGIGSAWEDHILHGKKIKTQKKNKNQKKNKKKQKKKKKKGKKTIYVDVYLLRMCQSVRDNI